jgi:hypothetical protein
MLYVYDRNIKSFNVGLDITAVAVEILISFCNLYDGCNNFKMVI